MGTPVPLRCPLGCDTELAVMGAWAPYRTCPSCGSGFWTPPAREEYWGSDASPSADQTESWAGRDALRDAVVGPGPGRLLDMGSGFGHFVSWAAEHGWDAWGCEPDTAGRQQSVSRDRVVGDLDELEGTFDLITAWDVLEHVTEPLDFLRSLRQKAAPGGRIVIASPNFAALKLRWELLRRSPGGFDRVVRPEEHPLALTYLGTQLALERAGFHGAHALSPPLAHSSNRVVNLAVSRIRPLRRGLFVQAYAGDAPPVPPRPS